MIIKEDDYLMHYGILRKSGRYPWGSGEDTIQRSRTFMSTIAEMRKAGMTDPEIAKSFSTKEHPFTTTDLRAMNTIARAETKAADITRAERLKAKGLSNVAIGDEMGINESSVRSLLAPGQKEKTDILQTTAQMLRDQVAEKGYLDIGRGVENHLGISKEKLATAVAMLKEEGYHKYYVKVQQLGTGEFTSVMVLAKPGTPYSELYHNPDKIRQITDFSEDGGRSFLGIQPPLSISSSRVGVRYAEEGGKDADGVIYVRPGVPDVSIGNARYAQVRIAVDGTHYLKGMAVYKDDLPDGVDLLFNTNKSSTGNHLDAMKALKDDADNPFGATIRQRLEVGADGKTRVTSVMNIVGSKPGAGEEGSWETWSKNLPSQFLSKQSPSLARNQLDIKYTGKKAQLEEIMTLTNPAVRKKMLEDFAEGADSSAIHLKAAALPGQATHVILPVNSLKDTEVYAPNYENGTRVALVRFPHGGTFEIPELTVNNNHPESKSLLGRASDAIGINSKVAERLSGADFDGDTVLVIPNNAGKVKSSPALDGLKGFDPMVYKLPADSPIKRMTPKVKGIQMGDVSNLITDMSIQKASLPELARAVRHSMVVIDAEKHNLNYRQSAIDNGIAQLKAKYQGSERAGAATLISRAGGTEKVNDRRARRAAEGGPIDPQTGEKMYVETGKTRTVTKVSKRTGDVTVNEEPVKIEVNRLANTPDAHTLSSGTVIESIYADHANRLKALANQARKEALATKARPVSDSATKVYKPEVDSLVAKLNVAKMNAPLERQAQILATSVYKTKTQANPNMEASEKKRLKNQALTEARLRVGAKKERVEITPREWEAIQAGAISNNRLTDILANADMDAVKKLATPKTQNLMTSTNKQRAQALLTAGYTQADVAKVLGVSLTTLKTSLKA